MNTEVTVEGALGLAAWFGRVEAALSRFQPGSPLSVLNRSQGRWVVVPDLLYQAVLAALQAAEMTGGAFDPTVLDALEAAGYSRSFEQGPAIPARAEAGAQTGTVGSEAGAGAGRWQEVRVAAGAPLVWLPPGVRLDLGGIGKGLAVDGALEKACRWAGPAPTVMVNAGGDLALRVAPGEPPILVEVDDPFQPDNTLTTFELFRGAVATSSTLGRAWGSGLHHIIDPRTGRPTDSGIVQATVAAGSAARAEVLAKACVVLGREAGLALLQKCGVHGILVGSDRTVTLTPGMEELLWKAS